MSTMDQKDFTARSHKDYIMHVLDMYDRSVDSVQCLIGDNCSTNKLLANLMQVPLVGCASHRLNLAVKKIYEDNIELIEKVDEIMANLNNLKNRIILGYLMQIVFQLCNN